MFLFFWGGDNSFHGGANPRTVAKVLLGRPFADVTDTPLFYKLMLAGPPETSQEARLWFVRVLRRALAITGPSAGMRDAKTTPAIRQMIVPTMAQNTAAQDWKKP